MDIQDVVEYAIPEKYRHLILLSVLDFGDGVVALETIFGHSRTREWVSHDTEINQSNVFMVLTSKEHRSAFRFAEALITMLDTDLSKLLENPEQVWSPEDKRVFHPSADVLVLKDSFEWWVKNYEAL